MPRKIRQIRVEGNIAYVPLTRGYEAIIDASDVPLVSEWNWHAKPHGKTVYAARTSSQGCKTVRMHRVITNDQTSLETDHIDGNGLNNTRANLRAVTRSQNNCNRSIPSSNTSGAKGVYWNKSAAKWRAQIRINGKKRHLGDFANLEDAAASYAAASALFHGKHGKIE